MEGRFEDYTLGRNIEMERVKEIYRLSKKHGFRLAGLRSFGEYVTPETVAAKRKLADELRNDPVRFARLQHDAAAKLATIPVMSKGVPQSGGISGAGLLGLSAVTAAAATLGAFWLTRKLRRS